MDQSDILQHIQSLLNRCDENRISGTYVEVCEFLRVYAGPNNEFYKAILSYGERSFSYETQAKLTNQLLRSFSEFIKAGLLSEVSPERRAQLDVVGDYLEMAHTLLETSGVHPAAPAVIIGATLEEFLRTWIDNEGIALGNKKPSLETYSQLLRDAGLLTKQDGKDITSWGGIRNHAAHGEWNEVADKNRVSLMLEGVNLFLRKYTP